MGFGIMVLTSIVIYIVLWILLAWLSSKLNSEDSPNTYGPDNYNIFGSDGPFRR